MLLLIMKNKKDDLGRLFYIHYFLCHFKNFAMNNMLVLGVNAEPSLLGEHSRQCNNIIRQAKT